MERTSGPVKVTVNGRFFDCSDFHIEQFGGPSAWSEAMRRFYDQQLSKPYEDKPRISLRAIIRRRLLNLG